MSKATLCNAAQAAIKSALASENVLASATASYVADIRAAYAAVVAAQDNGVNDSDMATGLPVTATTVGDYGRAGRMNASAWDRLPVVRTKTGRTYGSMHALIGSARQGKDTTTGKAYGIKPIDALIRKAIADTASLPNVEDTGAPDPARVARIWSAVVTRLSDMAADRPSTKKKDEGGKKKDTDPNTDTDPDTDTEDTDPVTGGDTPPVLDGRVARLASDIRGVHVALDGGALVSPEALAALYASARDLVSFLADAQGKARKASGL